MGGSSQPVPQPAKAVIVAIMMEHVVAEVVEKALIPGTPWEMVPLVVGR